MIDAGMRYYLVIDGYGGDFGEYVVTTCDYPPCAFNCDPDAMLENEPPLVDGYVDLFNGGCDAEEPVFQTLELPPGEQELVFCGTTGWFDTGGPQRDSDWFELMATGEQVTVLVHAPYTIDLEVEVLFLQDCENVSVLPYQLSTCATDVIEVPTYPGQIVYLRVRPLSPTQTACSYSSDIYELYVSGLNGPVAVEQASWSSVRSLYR